MSVESLAEEMWQHTFPDSQANALQAHVSRLRRRVREPEPARAASRGTIHPSGHRLLVADGELDATEFVRTIRLAEWAFPQDAARTARLLGDALAL
ncbi:hypothetical protein [Streptomyces diastatochromogenes]|uniref:hypothetical protein n=1 Tax=Streptomyces diastatochromogenes TaxID=42236 RepID=UPI0036B49164